MNQTEEFATRGTKEWFEMRNLTRARLATGVWVPLYVSDEKRDRNFGDEGYWLDYNGVCTFAVLQKNRDVAETLDWSRVAETHKPSFHGRKYHSVETILSADEKPVGVRLALVQRFPGDLQSRWTLSQDLVFALGLLREGDSWLSPQDGFIEVAQLRRNGAGKSVGLYIKPDYLKDYLAARKMALRIVQLRQRQATVRTNNTFGWVTKRFLEKRDGGSFTGYAWPIGGESVMVMQIGRRDNWSPDELPEMGPPSDSDIVSDRRTFNRPQHGLHAAEGEFRRAEWLEAAASSPRVRHEEMPSTVTFIVDGSGQRQSADKLNDEDVGKWLWFKPGVISTILSYRGASITWYTRFTAGILLSIESNSVHFGINQNGVVVTYARDVARLSEWERVVWAGFNIAPEGGLPDELKQAQVEGRAAETQAPEKFFGKSLLAVDTATTSRWGWPLFREHASTEEIASSVHRYRALDEVGFLSLAKDIARLTADSIDTSQLQTTVTLTKGEKLGSLKLLERSLGTLVSSDEAKTMMTVLVGVYELRLGDAHLPSEKIRQAFALAGVSEEEPPLFRAAHLIHNVTATLFRIAKAIELKYG